MGARDAVVILVCALSPMRAMADGAKPFVSGGVALGAAIHDVGSSGFLVGGELSGGVVASTKRSESETGPPRWLGGYAALLRDFGSDTTRLDGGVVREFGDDPAWGFTIRPVFTLGVVAAFVRYTRFGGDREEASHTEVGLLLKLPYSPGTRW